MLDYNVYIEQILIMIEKLRRTDLDKLETDDFVFDATVMRLQVIGESASKISSKMRKKYSHMDWNSLIRTRDFVSHNYEKIEIPVMRSFILNKILSMEESLKKILKEENVEK